MKTVLTLALTVTISLLPLRADDSTEVKTEDTPTTEQSATETEQPTTDAASANATPATAAAEEEPSIAGAELADMFNYLAVIKDGRSEGGGSGFIALFNGKPFLFTNAHVLEACERPSGQLLTGQRLVFDPLWSANDADLMLIEQQELPTEGFEILEAVHQNVKIGDEVIVLGNSLGSGVATEIRGKVTGIGPKQIEVDAKFVRGNSGSPIIHRKTRKVIGIATYGIMETLDDFDKDSKFEKVIRRFGYRIDNVEKWTRISWAAYAREAASLRKISGRTEDIRALIIDIATNGKIKNWTQHLSPQSQISTSVKQWREAINRNSRTSKTQAMSETSRFVNNMIASLDGDMRIRPFTLPWNQHRMEKIREERKPMRDFFEAGRKNLLDHGR